MLARLKQRFLAIFFTLLPPYAGTGASIDYIAPDFHEVRIRLPLSWRTRNLVGTTFGGSMYAAVDPIYMTMLIKILGPRYIIWDKAACIRFKRPGKETLFARFVIEPAEVEAIKDELNRVQSLDRVYTVDLVDQMGTVHASVEKTIYIRSKDAPAVKRAA